MVPAAGRGAAVGMREGEWDCEEGFVTRPLDCSFSREDSLECAMYRARAVCGSSSPAFTECCQSSSSSFMGDRGENLRGS